MSLYAYQLTKAQENWFANNVEGYYNYAPNNLQKILFLYSDNPSPNLNVYIHSLEVTASSFLLVGEEAVMHVLFSVGLVWRDLRAMGINRIPPISTDPRLAQELSKMFEGMKSTLADIPDITQTFFNSDGTIGGALFPF